MNHDEYTTNSRLVGVAYENWYNLLGNNGHREFWKFVSPTKRYEAVSFYDFTPDEVNRLKLLNGPYHVAIIKAYEARRKKNNDQSVDDQTGES